MSSKEKAAILKGLKSLNIPKGKQQRYRLYEALKCKYRPWLSADEWEWLSKQIADRLKL